MSDSSNGLRLIDSDVHPHFQKGLNDLGPYMELSWRKRMRLDVELESWISAVPASQYVLPKNETYIVTPGAMRRDASEVPGQVPASDPKFVSRHLLDQHGIDRAVLIGGNVLGVSSLPNPELAAAVASAYNNWLVDTWLSADERFRGALLIPGQNPIAAAAEIRRMADQPGIVAIMLPVADILLGEAFFHPVYAAAAEVGLPVLLHLTGTESIFARGAQFPGGPPTYYIEWHVGVATIYQANVTSLLAHGIFERFPKLRVAVVEGGIAWLLDLIWRFDKDWEALRDEVPWLKRPPSEYLREFVKLTVQPMPEPAKPEHFAQFVEMTQSQDMLMFSSDYPHWDFDNPLSSLKGLGPDLRRRIQVDNAVALYGERLTRSLAKPARAPSRAAAGE
jgi:uncharacterized protein